MTAPNDNIRRLPPRLTVVEAWTDPASYEPELDPDERTVAAFRAELHDGLIWLGLGALAGSMATVLAAYILANAGVL